jgi:hypothetical protein
VIMPGPSKCCSVTPGFFKHTKAFTNYLQETRITQVPTTEASTPAPKPKNSATHLGLLFVPSSSPGDSQTGDACVIS